MDRIDRMQIFTRIVDAQSFSKVARTLNVPASTVTDAIKALEADLGVSLLRRTTRVVRPTLDGKVYYQRCLRILADIEDAAEAFTDATPKGLLRIEVHGILASHFLMPNLSGFLSTYPDIKIHIGEGDRLVDLVREGVDCTIRVGEVQDSDMIVRKLGELEQVTCASPAYVTQFGDPESLDDLDSHKMIGFHSSKTGTVLPLEFYKNSKLIEKSLPSRINVSGAIAYTDAARLGLGIIQKPRYAAQQDLDGGQLVELLPDFHPPLLPVHVLYPRDRHLSKRVRVFIEWAVESFRKGPLYS